MLLPIPAELTEAERPKGILTVPNIGLGDLEINFDKGVKEDIERARGIIEDMLKRGYTIYVELSDGSTRRVERFDGRMNHYIVTDANKPKRTKRKAKPQRVPMTGSRATAVAPTAGG